MRYLSGAQPIRQQQHIGGHGFETANVSTKAPLPIR
jgi:hypothetical protein